MSDIPSNFGDGAGEGPIVIPPQYDVDFCEWIDELAPASIKELAIRDIERFAITKTHDAKELMANIGLIGLGIFDEFITSLTPKNKK